MTTNTDNAGTATNTPEGIPPLNPLQENPDANSIAGEDIQLPTFNGNGAEDPKHYWVICEVVWMVRLVQNVDLKKTQMITTLRGHALNWFMNFCVVPLGTP